MRSGDERMFFVNESIFTTEPHKPAGSSSDTRRTASVTKPAPVKTPGSFASSDEPLAPPSLGPDSYRHGSKAASSAADPEPVKAAYTPKPEPERFSHTSVRPVYADTASRAPAGRLKHRRGLIKLIILSILTLGIYFYVFHCSLSVDINIVAHRYDGKRTMHYSFLLFVSALTLGIGALVWYHRLSKRIGRELSRRGIYYSFGAGSFWGWNILGMLIIIGPMVYTHKLCKAMNLICSSYNREG